MAIPQGEQKAAITGGTFESAKATVKLTPALAKMLSSDIYQYPKEAVIREILSNCRDIMALVGNLDTHSIELTLPNAFKPNLVFRDYGTGLTQEQAFEMYLSFGESSKQSSNVEVGMFGIGSKSPLSYADSFIIESFQQGIKTSYNIHMDEGIPNISKLFEQPTTEEDGLAVNIAIKHEDQFAFRQAVKKFLKFFDAPVKVLGDTSFEVELAEFSLENDLYKVCTNYPAGAYGLMGGVIYRLSDQIRENLSETIKSDCVILPFEIGELSPAPTRENLTMDEVTTKNLEDRLAQIKIDYKRDLEAVIKSEPDLASLLKTLRADYGNLRKDYWGHSTMMDDLEWKGRTLAEWRSTTIKSEQYLKGAGFNGLIGFTATGKQINQNTPTLGSFFGFSGFYYSGARVDDSVEIIYKDKVNGSIKFSKEHAKRTHGRVCLVGSLKDAEDLRDLMVGLYPSINLVSIADNYLTYFPKQPKGSTTKRRVSGAFQHTTAGLGLKDVADIEVIDGELVAYIPMVRNKVYPSTSDGRTSASSYFWLLDEGVVDKLYFIRKTASKKLLKGLVDMSDESEVIPRLQSKVKEKDVLKLAKINAQVQTITGSYDRGTLNDAGFVIVQAKHKDLCDIRRDEASKVFSKNELQLLSKAVELIPNYKAKYEKAYSQEAQELQNIFKGLKTPLVTLKQVKRDQYRYTNEEFDWLIALIKKEITSQGLLKLK